MKRIKNMNKHFKNFVIDFVVFVFFFLLLALDADWIHLPSSYCPECGMFGIYCGVLVSRLADMIVDLIFYFKSRKSSARADDK